MNAVVGAACALAVGATALLVPPRPSVGVGSGPRWPPSVVVVSGSVTTAALLVLAAGPRVLALAGVAAGTVVAACWFVSRRRADRSAAQVRSHVVQMCDGLYAELAAGQTAATALDRAAVEWPLLSSAGRASATGGDVVVALRELATVDGAGDLRVVAAAWQVAHRTGHGLADALARVAQELRDRDQTARVVAGELASARATARLVAGLPLVALALGSGAGADPWSFLLGHPVGLACLAGGIGCGVAGLAWIEALARDVERAR